MKSPQFVSQRTICILNDMFMERYQRNQESLSKSQQTIDKRFITAKSQQSRA